MMMMMMRMMRMMTVLMQRQRAAPNVFAR